MLQLRTFLKKFGVYRKKIKRKRKNKNAEKLIRKRVVKSRKE